MSTLLIIHKSPYHPLVGTIVYATVLYILSFIFIWQIRDYTYLFLYDVVNENPVVSQKKEIDRIINLLEQVRLSDLDKDYKRISKIDDATYSKMHKNAKYYLVDPKDVYKRIVGNTRIRNLVSRDEFYRTSIMNQSKPIYWRIDREILYKILELREELEHSSYNKNAFKITHGYRTPKHNETVGGAPKSRHIKGEAIDMVIKDVNQDGQYTDDDKQLVIDLLERKIIKNQGGIGKYPGTRVVHMDVRGYKARWDSY